MAGPILTELRASRVVPTPCPHLRAGQLGQEEKGKAKQRARGAGKGSQGGPCHYTLLTSSLRG